MLSLSGRYRLWHGVCRMEIAKAIDHFGMFTSWRRIPANGCPSGAGHGLHTCPQQAWVSFNRTIRSFLDLPDHLMVYSGMALGYEDSEAPINKRSPRAALDSFATFDGFSD